MTSLAAASFEARWVRLGSFPRSLRLKSQNFTHIALSDLRSLRSSGRVANHSLTSLAANPAFSNNDFSLPTSSILQFMGATGIDPQFWSWQDGQQLNTSYSAFAAYGTCLPMKPSRPGVDRERISQCCHDPSDAAPQRML